MAVERYNPKAFLAEAGEGRHVIVYKSGTKIFSQGEPTDLIFYLQRGKATETVEATTGKKAIVNVLESGAFFGTAGLDGSRARTSTVMAVTVCLVTAMTKQAMGDALNEPRFARMFLNYLIEQNSRVEAEKVDLMFNSSERRLAQRLLSLSHNGTARIDSKITQLMLAEMIGTTRPRVNKFMARFRSLGLIEPTEHGVIIKPTLLKVVTEEHGGGD